MNRTKALLVGGVAAGTALAAAWRRHRAMNLEGCSVLITGGSRGLGLLIAGELGRRGARVILAARDQHELERARRMLAAENIDVSTAVADIADREEAERLVESVVNDRGHLDILINNAGVIKVGPIDHMTDGDFEEAMSVHFWGPLHTMRAAIPHMSASGGGRIVNISSIGGKVGVPHLAPYCASKFALTGLSTSLRAELAGKGIRVTTVSRGLMRTGSPFNAWFKGRHRAEFAWFAVSGSMPLLSIEARRAARQIVEAARRGDAELIISVPAKVAALAAAAVPNSLARAMAMANGILPRATGEDGDTPRSGWQSTSRWAPSVLTRLTERAAEANNELMSTDAKP